MDNTTSLVERRWDKDDRTAAHRPVDMLRVAIAQIERGELKADHAILVLGYDNEDRSQGTQWLQAGQWPVYAQVGVLNALAVRILG